MAAPACVVPSGDWTGEGAVWHAGEQAVYWVDIGRFLIHRYDPATRAVRSWFFSEPVTTLGLTDRRDTLVVATETKIILWQPANDARADFADPEHGRKGVRFNDGRPDPAGNFWVGSMFYGKDADPKSKVGRLFRVNADATSSVEKTEIGISNTFCWSPDNTRFYFGDTTANAIWVWDYDKATGTIANQRPFFTGFERGGPDGSAMDSAGYLWNARYGGSCIVRVSPAGEVDRIIEMPVSNVTTCTFGGADLKTLFITSALKTGERLSGSPVTLAVDVPGLPENVFRLSR